MTGVKIDLGTVEFLPSLNRHRMVLDRIDERIPVLFVEIGETPTAILRLFRTSIGVAENNGVVVVPTKMVVTRNLNTEIERLIFVGPIQQFKHHKVVIDLHTINDG